MTGLEHGPLTTAARKAGLGSAIVSLKPPKIGDLLPLVQRWASERDISLAPDAARLLLEVSGENTGVLRSEVEKLASSVEPGTKLTAAEVKKLAGSSRTWQIREYVDRFMAKDSGAALGVLRQLEEWNTEPMLVMTWLTNSLLDMVTAKAGLLPRNLFWRVRDNIGKWESVPELNRVLQQLYNINRDFLAGRPGFWARIEVLTYCLGCPGSKDYCDVYADPRDNELCMIPAARRKRNVG
jgi:DNA polymerase III delta subunit